MKFKLTTAKVIYNKKDASFKKEVGYLKKLGFKFEVVQRNDELYKIFGTPEIELKSLKQLIEFTNQLCEVIVKGNTIEIYNGRRE